MRNETVERIVNLLFQDVEMTDEVQALYDETMSNCQERYQDMTSRGLSDDDAIAAVVESLKGMEDVISQYPKKSEAPEAEEAPKSADVPADDGGDGEQTDFTFHPADIGRIEMTMVCDDVHLEESPDGDVHVRFEDVEGAKASICHIEDGVLRVCRDPDAPKRNRSSFTVSGSFANGRLYVKKPNGEYFFFGDKKSDKQVEAEAERHAKEFEQHAKEFSDNMSKMGFKQESTGDGKNPNSIESMIDSFASTASRFGQELGKLFSSIKPNITVSRSIGDVTLCIPVFFFHFFDKGKGLFFCFHRTDGCDETGFFFHKFAFAAFVYGFIMFQHGLRLRYLYPTLCFRQSFLYCIIIIFIAQCIRYHEL